MTITITKSGGLGSFTCFGFHYNKAKTSLSHSHSLPIPTPFINEENKGFVKTALINMPLPYACPSPCIYLSIYMVPTLSLTIIFKKYTNESAKYLTIYVNFILPTTLYSD